MYLPVKEGRLYLALEESELSDSQHVKYTWRGQCGATAVSYRRPWAMFVPAEEAVRRERKDFHGFSLYAVMMCCESLTLLVLGAKKTGEVAAAFVREGVSGSCERRWGLAGGWCV